MPLHRFARTCAVAGTFILAAALATPALAHGKGAHHEPGVAPGGPDNRPLWKEGRPDYDAGRYAMDPRAREDWLVECRRRAADNGLGGALIGGLAGGVVGNRVAGKGDRTIGTVAGAAIGAVAGAAIDKEEDRGRVRDDCEAYLDSYQPGPHGHPGYAPGHGYGYGYGYPAAYGYYGYAVPMVMVPVMLPKQDCIEEEVIEEYVTVPARRHIRRAPARDKRIRIAPDKRVRIK